MVNRSVMEGPCVVLYGLLYASPLWSSVGLSEPSTIVYPTLQPRISSGLVVPNLSLASLDTPILLWSLLIQDTFPFSSETTGMPWVAHKSFSPPLFHGTLKAAKSYQRHSRGTGAGGVYQASDEGPFLALLPSPFHPTNPNSLSELCPFKDENLQNSSLS